MEQAKGDIASYYFGGAWEKLEGLDLLAQQALAAGVMASTLPASGLPAEVRSADARWQIPRAPPVCRARTPRPETSLLLILC